MAIPAQEYVDQHAKSISDQKERADRYAKIQEAEEHIDTMSSSVQPPIAVTFVLIFFQLCYAC